MHYTKITFVKPYPYAHTDKVSSNSESELTSTQTYHRCVPLNCFLYAPPPLHTYYFAHKNNILSPNYEETSGNVAILLPNMNSLNRVLQKQVS